ncbi:AraC family transcriptional regulator [Phycisphaerales bacterium AB-hyl4]|uniref:AraC family transcriptional regulator n=1 Tax=Natronomicrosphaera hydrolytica TaxID=3242702 RepID=A0ABV4U2R4_9BACT
MSRTVRNLSHEDDAVDPMPAVGASPVRQVLLCREMTRTEAGEQTVASSLPGHLLQLTLVGSAVHDVAGRRYTLGPGDLIWFHEDESVHVEVVSAPWTFLTLNVIAPSLAPPAFERRVRRTSRSLREQFRAVHTAWQDRSLGEAQRSLRVHGRVLSLLAELAEPAELVTAEADDAAWWWEIETRCRKDLSQPMSLSVMQAMTRRSRATITRACRRATGLPPMRRIRQIRMSMARGLLRHSTLQVTQIADRLGYPRINEFSRDYRKHFGCSPRHERERAEQNAAETRAAASP